MNRAAQMGRANYAALKKGAAIHAAVNKAKAEAKKAKKKAASAKRKATVEKKQAKKAVAAAKRKKTMAAKKKATKEKSEAKVAQKKAVLLKRKAKKAATKAKKIAKVARKVEKIVEVVKANNGSAVAAGTTYRQKRKTKTKRFTTKVQMGRKAIQASCPADQTLVAVSTARKSRDGKKHVRIGARCFYV